jgi:hypothetical protein
MKGNIRVKVHALGNHHSIGCLEVIPGHDVVDIVDSSWPHSDFGEISGPSTEIGILSLILR